jgi:universal stress protein A
VTFVVRAKNASVAGPRHSIREWYKTHEYDRLPRDERTVAMKLRKILFPSDFSTKGDEALEYATSLARASDALLLILHVQEPPIAYGEGSFYYGVANPGEKEVREMLTKIKPSDPEVKYEYRFAEGEPAAEITKLAKSEGVDLIVMSSHGRTGLNRLLMGSVAECVMRRAPCPVLIVKPAEPAIAEQAAGRNR